MPDFIELRFPDSIAYGAVGGPGFMTSVVATGSGFEKRNRHWSQARRRWNVAHGVKTETNFEELVAFFNVVAGRAIGFRFKDWADFKATLTTGFLGTGVGAGIAAYQMGRNYSNAAGAHLRPITKPVAGTAKVYRGGIEIPAGASPGQWALDTTTGVVTFVPDNSANVTNVVPNGTTRTRVTLASAIGLAVNDLLWTTGVVGTIGPIVNDLALPIKAILTSTTYEVESANATGLAYTSGGVGYAFPQPDENLRWTGEFDVPSRFDTDQLSASVDTRAPDGGFLLNWSDIPVVEVRL